MSEAIYNNRIHTDQIGFLPGCAKKVIVVTGEDTRAEDIELFLEDAETGERIEDAVITVSGPIYDNTADETVYQADLSGVTKTGTYRVVSGDGSSSVSFRIAPDVYRDALKGICKALYYQRCGCELKEEHAGEFARSSCHEDPAYLYSDVMAALGRKDSGIPGEGIDVCGGWHDAGDYGRYSSAAATAMGHLMYAYELFPKAFSFNMNIPESGNGVPDILNECRYELEFLLRMQDDDGGIYHKVTTIRHADFVMPCDDKGRLVIFPVSSVSTASVAAVFCAASRVYEKYDPDFARTLVHAAVSAGKWLLDHPDNVEFRNPEGVNTGEYGDTDDRDERLWAYIELMRTDLITENEYDHSEAARKQNGVSRQERYRSEMRRLRKILCASHRATIKDHYDVTEKGEPAPGQKPVLFDGFGWTDVSGMAMLPALMYKDSRELFDEEDLSEMKQIILEKCRIFIDEQKASGYILGMQDRDFVWGSNMVVTNRADILAFGSLLSDDEGFKKECSAAAVEQLHYLFGRNALDVSYVTGFGEHAYRHPHNRVTESDGIDEPIPGEVSGGPCFPPLDPIGKSIVPEGSPAQKCYTDHAGCYSLNEITIYWNSSAAFILAFVCSEVL